MNRISLLFAIVLLSQTIAKIVPSFSLKDITNYEKKGAREMFRGHEGWLKENYPNVYNEIYIPRCVPNSPRQTIPQQSPLKGSTEKTNDNK